MLYILAPAPGYMIGYWILATGYMILDMEMRFFVVEIAPEVTLYPEI